MAILVVFLFLGSFRATRIPMLAVPVALVRTFAVFIPLGFTMNTLTLFDLVLAARIVSTLGSLNLLIGGYNSGTGTLIATLRRWEARKSAQDSSDAVDSGVGRGRWFPAR